MSSRSASTERAARALRVRLPRHARELSSFFFFQAEDGIRDVAVTGVQTCALPIFCLMYRVAQFRNNGCGRALGANLEEHLAKCFRELRIRRVALGVDAWVHVGEFEIGRASCRERV